MKRILLLYACMLLLLSCDYQDNGITSINDLITSDYLLTDNLDSFISQNQIVRLTGKPGITTISIGGADLSKYQPCFVLYVATGTTPETTATSAIIKLDGMIVLSTSDFSKNAGQYKFEVCNLCPTSVLTVEVRGEPGSYVSVWIEGKLKEVDADCDGYTVTAGDCDDTNSSVFPGAEEICGDGIDQDCDGADLVCIDTDEDGLIGIDDNCPYTYNPLQQDSDGDGIGDACDLPCTGVVVFDAAVVLSPYIINNIGLDYATTQVNALFDFINTVFAEVNIQINLTLIKPLSTMPFLYGDWLGVTHRNFDTWKNDQPDLVNSDICLFMVHYIETGYPVYAASLSFIDGMCTQHNSITMDFTNSVPLCLAHEIGNLLNCYPHCENPNCVMHVVVNGAKPPNYICNNCEEIIYHTLAMKNCYNCQ